MTEEEKKARLERMNKAREAKGTKPWELSTPEAKSAGHAKKREKRNSQKELEFLLNLSLFEGREDTPESILNLAGITGKNITVRQAINLAQIKKALEGDTQSAIYVRDTVGEKPTDKIDIGPTIEDYVKNHKVKL